MLFLPISLLFGKKRGEQCIKRIGNSKSFPFCSFIIDAVWGPSNLINLFSSRKEMDSTQSTNPSFVKKRASIKWTQRRKAQRMGFLAYFSVIWNPVSRWFSLFLCTRREKGQIFICRYYKLLGAFPRKQILRSFPLYGHLTLWSGVYRI